MSELPEEHESADTTIFRGRSSPSEKLPVVSYDGSTEGMVTRFGSARGASEEATRFGESARPAQAVDDQHLAPGDRIIHGSYLIERRLKSGNEAQAYLGFDAFDAERKVFVKYLRSDRVNPEYAQKKSQLRDRLLGITHPNCLKMIATDIADSAIVEVYEFIEGQTLGAFLKENPRPSDDFIREALRQIAEGLHHFQTSLQLAHRDLKPDNIMLTNGPNPRFVIADYGTVSATDLGGVTTTEYTKYYAPPEALRSSLRRDADLYSFDWWSLGRIIQEMADGMPIKEKIRGHAPTDESDSASIAHVFETIMSEQERHIYDVRAGMVEWSNSSWTLPLRGLLTSSRQLRWKYSQTMDWLQGLNVTESYDAPIDVAPFRYLGVNYDLPNAASVLAQMAHWDDAVCWVVEGTGIMEYVRKSGNQRFMAQVASAANLYEKLLKYGNTVAEDLTTALTLSVIATDTSMPLTIRGKIVNRASIESAVHNKAGDFLHALIDDSFLAKLKTLSGTENTALYELLSQMRDALKMFADWTVGAELANDPFLTIVQYTLASEEWRLKTYQRHKKDIAGSSNPEIDSIFQNFATASPLCQIVVLCGLHLNARQMGFMTHVQAQADEVRQLKESLQQLRRDVAIASLSIFTTINATLGEGSTRLRFLGVCAAIGLCALEFDSLLNDGDTIRSFLLSMLECIATLMIARNLLGRCIPSYAWRMLQIQGSPSLLILRGYRRELGAPKNILQFAKKLRAVVPRALQRAGLHPELRLNPLPVPILGSLFAVVITLCLALIPIGAVRIGNIYLTLRTSKISDRAFAERITTAYIHGSMRTSDRYVSGQAQEYLDNRLRLGNYSQSLKRFGRFLEIRQQNPGLPLPGHSSFLVHFERCMFVESIARDGDRIVGFAFKAWHPLAPNGCMGRDTSQL